MMKIRAKDYRKLRRVLLDVCSAHSDVYVGYDEGEFVTDFVNLKRENHVKVRVSKL